MKFELSFSFDSACCGAGDAGLGMEQARMAAIKDRRLTSTGRKVPFSFISSVTVGRKVTGG